MPALLTNISMSFFFERILEADFKILLSSSKSSSIGIIVFEFSFSNLSI